MTRRSPLPLLLTIGIGLMISWFLFVFFWPDPPLTNLDSSGTDIIAFGDSLIAGTGATEGFTLPDQIGSKIGKPVINEGVPGETTRTGLARIDDTLDHYHPRLMIVSLGGNDFLQKIPREETRENLAYIIEKIQKRGALVMILGVRSGVIGGGFDDSFEALAKQYNTLYVSDVLKGIFGDTRYMSDAVHPNNQGYKKIAERIIKELNDHQVLK